MHRTLGISFGLLTFACSAAQSSVVGSQVAADEENRPATAESTSKSNATTAPAPAILETVRAPSLPPPDQWQLTANYTAHLETARKTSASLEESLGPAASPHRPDFGLQRAQHYELLRKRLTLSAAQAKQLQESGFISLAMEDPDRQYSMAALYLKIWQAELPVLITTDSVLHAWHRSYDDSLMQFEVNEAMPAYRKFLEGMRSSLKQTYPKLPHTLKESARDLDVYLAVALSLLGPELTDRERYEIRVGKSKAPDAVVSPLDAPKKLVDGILRAIASETARSFSIYGSSRHVDFSQFKVRGHYNESEDLKKYFRAAMWMGRADTGFTLLDSKGKVHTRSARTALLAGHLARQSGQLEAFTNLQKSIDYFVGTANGLSIGDLVVFLDDAGITETEMLADASRIESLAAQLAQAGPKDRVTSQGIASTEKEPPPLVFQLASQRFTIDSFVHDQLSSDEVEDRFMVTAPEVFAAFGGDEATRLIGPQVAKFEMSDEVGALRRTISDLPQSYWEQNIYTRWFDALRVLDDVPDNQHFPKLFEGRGWQRKQLQTQLASFAELRRDTILYVAQSYASIVCDFPAMYVEPYPAFFDRMEQMALGASRHLNNAKFFKNFADIMARLERAAQAQLDGKDLAKEDREFLYHLVKRDLSSFGCGPPTITWTGWYKDLFWDGDVDLWEPVIADVFTDPNTDRTLNVATASPELAIIAIETKNGPGIFVGPIYGYREFVGKRISDHEWQKTLRESRAPEAPAWTSDFQSGQAPPPKPHPPRKDDPARGQHFY